MLRERERDLTAEWRDSHGRRWRETRCRGWRGSRPSSGARRRGRRGFGGARRARPPRSCSTRPAPTGRGGGEGERIGRGLGFRRGRQRRGPWLLLGGVGEGMAIESRVRVSKIWFRRRSWWRTIRLHPGALHHPWTAVPFDLDRWI